MSLPLAIVLRTLALWSCVGLGVWGLIRVGRAVAPAVALLCDLWEDRP